MCGNNCGYGNCGYCGGGNFLWILILLMLLCGNGICGLGCGCQNNCCCDHGNQNTCC